MPVIITLWDDTCQRLKWRDWQVFFQGEIQGNMRCCLSVTGLGTSPRHPLALGQSEFMCPWPLLISYPICILIHSFNCVLFHWCFCRNCRKGNITFLVFVLLSTTLLCTLFCHCSVLSSLLCLPSLILFFPFITSRHIALFLTFNLPPSCFSPITLWTPFFSWIISHFFSLELSSLVLLGSWILLERAFKKLLLPQFSSAVIVTRDETALACINIYRLVSWIWRLI